MNVHTWQSKLDCFRLMSQIDQLAWLSNLILLISMSARNTYEPGTDAVTRPEDLRRFNELVHRVATFQRRIATKSVGGLPDEALFQMLENQLGQLGVNTPKMLEMLP